ncbi:hypothetical protein Trydic_g3890 [Trypoxylus dichotomus]
MLRGVRELHLCSPGPASTEGDIHDLHDARGLIRSLMTSSEMSRAFVWGVRDGTVPPGHDYPVPIIFDRLPDITEQLPDIEKRLSVIIEQVLKQVRADQTGQLGITTAICCKPPLTLQRKATHILLDVIAAAKAYHGPGGTVPPLKPPNKSSPHFTRCH